MKVKDIAKHIEEWCPKSLAEDWDNVGLLVGESEQEVKKVMVALDAIDEVIDEAIKENVDMIVTHHPIIFKPIKNVTTNHTAGRLIHKLIKNNISLYSAHTNLDSASGGINDLLADMLELKNVITSATGESSLDIVRIGEIREQSISDFSNRIKKVLGLEQVKVIGDLSFLIKKVAICSGSGMSLIKDVAASNVDVYLTGDVKYHDANDAIAMGINVIDAGHYETEVIILPVLKRYLEKLEGLEVIKTSVDGNPFKII